MLPNKNHSNFTSPYQCRGFTLIELLLVIAIIALLVSLLIPGLRQARKMCFQARELSAAQQSMAAFALYADDSKGRVMPGFPSASMVAGPLVVTDESGERLTGDVAQRYPWRLAPYFDYNFRGLYKDQRVLELIREAQATYTPMGVDYRYVISLFPTLGMNTAFIGGSAHHLAFTTPPVTMYGKFYVSRIDEPQRTDKLIVFCGARAEQQPALPTLGMPQGYFRVDAPYFITRNWQATYDPNAAFPGNNSGFVACRYGNKAVTALFDGHAAVSSWEDLQDMRRWSDRATSPTWRLGQ